MHLESLCHQKENETQLRFQRWANIKPQHKCWALWGLIWQPTYDIPLILFEFPHEILMFAAYAFYFVATVLTVWTMVIYFKAAWPDLKGE